MTDQPVLPGAPLRPLRRGDTVRCSVSDPHAPHIWVPPGFPYPMRCGDLTWPDWLTRPLSREEQIALTRAQRHFHGDADAG
jgi:hypothetical protein